jgi:hypothetical protein
MTISGHETAAVWLPAAGNGSFARRSSPQNVKCPIRRVFGTETTEVPLRADFTPDGNFGDNTGTRHRTHARAR